MQVQLGLVYGSVAVSSCGDRTSVLKMELGCVSVGFRSSIAWKILVKLSWLGLVLGFPSGLAISVFFRFRQQSRFTFVPQDNSTTLSLKNVLLTLHRSREEIYASYLFFNGRCFFSRFSSLT